MSCRLPNHARPHLHAHLAAHTPSLVVVDILSSAHDRYTFDDCRKKRERERESVCVLAWPYGRDGFTHLLRSASSRSTPRCLRRMQSSVYSTAMMIAKVSTRPSVPSSRQFRTLINPRPCSVSSNHEPPKMQDRHTQLDPAALACWLVTMCALLGTVRLPLALPRATVKPLAHGSSLAHQAPCPAASSGLVSRTVDCFSYSAAETFPSCPSARSTILLRSFHRLLPNARVKFFPLYDHPVTQSAD